MKEKLKVLQELFLRSWTPSEKSLLLVDVLLFGVLLGWLTSPRQKLAVRLDMDEDAEPEDEKEDAENDEEDE